MYDIYTDFKLKNPLVSMVYIKIFRRFNDESNVGFAGHSTNKILTSVYILYVQKYHLKIMKILEKL